MSYFGMIPFEEIKDIIAKADNFLKEYIEKYNDKKEDLDKEG